MSFTRIEYLARELMDAFRALEMYNVCIEDSGKRTFRTDDGMYRLKLKAGARKTGDLWINIEASDGE
jgi:hypothetical protein